MQSVYNIELNGINGNPLTWEKYKGKKIMIVNVASECGFTPQYAQLQDLYENYLDKMVIIGCPCNDFGGQEPGSPVEIVAFCDIRYRITFPMTEKMGIVKNRHPLFHFLCSKSENGIEDTVVKWNFYKFLLDENGHYVRRFPSTVSPIDQKVLDWLDS